MLEDVKARFTKVIRETDFQRQDRLDKEFQALQMGRMNRAEFSTAFEQKIAKMDEAGMSLPQCVPELRRQVG